MRGAWQMAVKGLVGCALVVGGTGCSAKTPTQVQGAGRIDLPLPTLVMSSPHMLESVVIDGDVALVDSRLDLGQWEYARRDSSLGAHQAAIGDAQQWVEVRHREFLRTINGRSSEHSTTTTHTIRRGWSR